MATVSFTISTEFLARMRAVIVSEQPSLAGQTNAQINEAARVRVRQMIREWVLRGEHVIAARSAQNGVAVPTDADIT